MEREVKCDISDVRHDENAGERSSLDSVREAAIGGESVSDLPRGYFSNLKVLGSCLVRLQKRTSGFRPL